MPEQPKTPGFASEAQRQKWQQLVRSGKVSQAQFDQREQDSPSNLPASAGTPRKPSTSLYTRALGRDKAY